MSLVNYPTVVAPYAGYVSELRVHLNRLVSFVNKQPGSKATVGAQVAAALASISFVPIPVSTKAIVSHGQAIAIGGSTYTLTVVGNVVTGIVVS